jgi:acetoin utilization deacetylase AcuC-like enzyme
MGAPMPPPVYYCDHFEVVLPPQNRFPMGKYALLRKRLVAEQVIPAADLHAGEPAPIEAVLAVHDANYVHRFLDGTLERTAMQRIGLPWSREFVARSLASAGGTLAAAHAALEFGLSGHLAGGTHHAHRAHGSGFCVFNDIAIAAVDLLARGLVKRVLVVDLDVHQGDGTASIFEHDERVFTFSMHGEHNFPARKSRGDLDVALPDRTGDDEYLASLRTNLSLAIERATPDFLIYQAGVDPLAGDRLGRLSLTHNGLFERDKLVFSVARHLRLPLVLTLGGGYSEPIDATLEAHVNTYRAARDCYGKRV